MSVVPFLHRQGTRIVDGAGRPVLLRGWGLGNWFLREGYMFDAGDIPRMDRGRRLEALLVELTGEAYAREFWRRFEDEYVTRDDLLYMKALGYNSVRIPMNWRALMEERDGVHWKPEGFTRLDRCLDWCEEAGLYAFLDLHGAPGGQTGANIDDGADDVPRMLMDDAYWQKALALWGALAERYRARGVVGGYDLLNEPIAPPRDGRDHDHLFDALARFYREAIAVIRRVDGAHLITLEGAHWATDLRVFTHRYDENMALHFHRYAEKPDIQCLQAFLDRARQLDVPLWLGESGENSDEWYAALFPLAESLGVGYNLWPWKKMSCANSPLSVRRPAQWDALLSYARGEAPLSREQARRVLDEYLHNISFASCERNEAVTRHVLRKPPFSLYAVDFDCLPGRDASWHSERPERGEYRRDAEMKIECARPLRDKRFVFDSQWERYSLRLRQGEFVVYSFRGEGDARLTVTLETDAPGALALSVGDARRILPFRPGDRDVTTVLPTMANGPTAARVAMLSGSALLSKLRFEPA